MGGRPLPWLTEPMVGGGSGQLVEGLFLLGDVSYIRPIACNFRMGCDKYKDA